MSSRRRIAAVADAAATGARPSASPVTTSIAASSAHIWAPLALALITLLLFLPARKFEYIPTDDFVHILSNPHLNPVTPAGLAHFWTAPYRRLYIPMSYMAYAFVGHFALGAGGYQPGPFHLANILLHAANTLLVYAILLRLVRQPVAAGFGAALFAWHPVQVESVAWISEMRGTVCGVFSFAAIYCYLRFAGTSPLKGREPEGPGFSSHGESAPGRRWVWWLAATVLFALALLSKPTAVALPLIVAILDLGMVRRRLADVAWSTVPWLLMAAVLVAITRSAQIVDRSIIVSVWLRPVVAFDTLAFYLGKVIFPWPLVFDYGRTPMAVIGHGWGYATAAAGLTATALCGWLGRRHPRILTAACLFGAAILPNSGLVPFDFQAISTVADRYLYVAMLGPALALACALARPLRAAGVAPIPGDDTQLLRAAGVAPILGDDTQLLKAAGVAPIPGERQPAWQPFAAAAIVLCVAAGVTCRELPYWHDPGRLFAHNVRFNSQSVSAWDNLCDYDCRKGNFRAGLDANRHVLAISPHFVDALDNQSYLLESTGHTEEAIDYARQAIAADPNFTKPYSRLGTMLVEEGHYEEAESVFAEGFRRGFSPGLVALVQYWWGCALLDDQSADDAREHLAEAVRLDPTNPMYSDTLALANQPGGLPPGTADALRGLDLAQSGHLDEAVQSLQATAAVYPHLMPALQNLAVTYYWLRRYPDSEREFNLILADHPDDPDMHLSLAMTLAAEGKTSDADPLARQHRPMRRAFDPERCGGVRGCGRPDSARRREGKGAD
ncbi:MAG: tetratricopeptide repeat protein [Capsulimonadaceae bacterium]